MLNRSALLARQAVRRQMVRKSSGHGYEHHDGGIPGENLPFSIGNPAKLAVMFSLFFGSGLAVPFFVLRHHLTKGQ